ncbi:MAG TPA: D-alanyl-D-alanine carboxypeptidase, partial [Acidimicrobiales bacterium]
MTTRRCSAAAALAALCLVTACSTAAPPEPDRLAAAAQAELPAPTFPPPTLASTTTTTAAPEPVAVEEPLAPPPPGLVEAVTERLGDPRFGGADVGLSVWVDGAGEVVAHRADVPLRPGSTEKLLVAAAALAVVGQDTTLVTELRSDGPGDG